LRPQLILFVAQDLLDVAFKPPELFVDALYLMLRDHLLLFSAALERMAQLDADRICIPST